MNTIPYLKMIIERQIQNSKLTLQTLNTKKRKLEEFVKIQKVSRLRSIL